ncbi:MAG: pyruvate kinase [Oligoflexales bacterium]|nr:pyruvate kinase [Oligoflexales bacterium]
MRKTKIVCTLGPATDNPEVLRQMFLNGMNVARLNFSHGNHAEHLKRVEAFKAIRSELGIPSAILLDTKGPEIRLKEFEKGSVELKKDNIFILTTEDIMGTEERVSITYKGLPHDLKKGNTILMADGLIGLSVIDIKEKDIICRVMNSGPISNRKSINIPDVKISLPYLSDEDRENILFAIKHDFDFIAASFVRSADCVKQIRRILEENHDNSVKIISKIENREGVDNIDEIIRVSDGIMIARGDMGVEIPFEELPALQKMIIVKSFQAGKMVITATQMLESMINNPRPTRAEITDVANAIYDGTSAIMLSGETSVGKYPVETLATMSKIATETENNIDYATHFQHLTKELRNVTDAISHATIYIAKTLDAKAIITVTKSGNTARMTSKYRPGCDIIATTTSPKVLNQLALSWGIIPVLTETKNTTDEIFNQAIRSSEEKGLIKSGDIVVITGGMPIDVSGTTNTVKVHVVGNVLIKGKGINNYSATGIIHIIDDDIHSIESFDQGSVLVIKKTTDKIIPLLKYASAIITEEYADDSKAALVGLALEIPVITEAIDAAKLLKSGTAVTVDAQKGQVTTGVSGVSS